MIGSTIDEKPATGAARATSARKSGAADAKSAPPAWVVSSTGTVARAEAGDVWAMEQIAYGNIGLARSLNGGHGKVQKLAFGVILQILETCFWCIFHGDFK